MSDGKRYEDQEDESEKKVTNELKITRSKRGLSFRDHDFELRRKVSCCHVS